VFHICIVITRNSFDTFDISRRKEMHVDPVAPGICSVSHSSAVNIY